MRTGWRRARLTERTERSASGCSLVLAVSGWPGHLPGQHVDVRLTADDGYHAVRSYSLATPAEGERVELGVEAVPDGEVSPYLAEEMPIGAELELRGPLGGWFVWHPGPAPAPLLLVGGGAGVVPLRAMLRARDRLDEPPPCHLVVSVRAPEQEWYRDEFAARDGGDVTRVWTRRAPRGDSRPPGRIGAADLALPEFGPDRGTSVYVCGPTEFVEHAAALLVDDLGHDPGAVRTERFG